MTTVAAAPAPGGSRPAAEASLGCSSGTSPDSRTTVPVGRPGPVRLLQRVRGPELRLLDDNWSSGTPATPRSDGIGLWPTTRSSSSGSTRPRLAGHARPWDCPASRVQDLRQGGLHPGALAGRENDDVEVRQSAVNRQISSNRSMRNRRLWLFDRIFWPAGDRRPSPGDVSVIRQNSS